MNGTLLDRHCARLRIIVLAMLGGVVVLTVIAYLLGGTGEHDAGFVQMMSLVLGMLGVGQVIGYLVVRNSMLRRIRSAVGSDAEPPWSADRVLPMLITVTIIGAAMAEGFGLFGAVLLLITGAYYFLAAPAIAILILLAHVPSRDRLERQLHALGVDAAEGPGDAGITR
jgi:hypothetical protein